MSGLNISFAPKFNPFGFYGTISFKIFSFGFKFTVCPICFASGTLIRTIDGDMAVEELKAGDVVVTAAGLRRPIKWVGRRSLDCREHPTPAMVSPIRVKAGAFGCGRPSRDLVLSPHHSVAVTCIDDVLIPIRLLVNGTTIAQLDPCPITYHHVELDSHDVLLANGLGAESFLDVGNRGEFEGETSLALYPEFNAEAAAAGYCRPLVTGGPILSAIRAQLADLAHEPATAPSSFRLLVDGTEIDPVVKNHTAAFQVPAGARDIRLVSPVWSPRDADPASADFRSLGILVQSLSVDDLVGTITDVPLNDTSLIAGFHPLEGGPSGHWRWTDGDALLSASIWQDCPGPFVLRLTGQFAFATESRLAEAA